ncbi:hypothetical protein ABEB36_014093 [Hypothenemus hampei]|uniref:Fanconi-associated nuclease n=1 Tax=Hypothenemus hampei TaxID=57062 RepID=A0ABD1E5D6_HYPHA
MQSFKISHFQSEQISKKKFRSVPTSSSSSNNSDPILIYQNGCEITNLCKTEIDNDDLFEESCSTSTKKGCVSQKKIVPLSPTKGLEIKGLRAKEGKQLQINQLKEFLNLIEIAKINTHLRDALILEEINILNSFNELEDDHKYVLLKLYVWQRNWYNAIMFCSKAKLEINNNKHIIAIFTFLAQEQFVETNYKETTDMLELLEQLKVKQIKEIMNELKINQGKFRTKPELIQTILTATKTQATLSKRTLKDLVLDRIEMKLGPAIKIRQDVSDTFDHIYALVTFTNPDFDNIQEYFWQIIHLKVIFPKTTLQDTSVFNSRDNFVNYVNARQLRALLNVYIDSKAQDKLTNIYNLAANSYDLLKELGSMDDKFYEQHLHLRKFTAQHVYCSILSICSEHIFTKNNGRPEEVKKWLEYLIENFRYSSRLGKWYEKLIRLHIRHLEEINYEIAIKLLFEALEVEIFTDRTRMELLQLGKQFKIAKGQKINKTYHNRLKEYLSNVIDESNFPQVQIDSHCIRSNVSGRKRNYVSRTADSELIIKSVEEVALDYYSSIGYPEGEHCEGSFIKALLMLYFWDIIYEENCVPGIFISPLQRAPLDMFTKYFYENRKKAIDERLTDIENRWPEKALFNFACENWENHSHEASAYGKIHDTIEDKKIIQLLVNVIGREILSNIFRRLIKNTREYSSGMPDLLVWNADQKIHKFVEVKGEKDKLASNQILWLNYLKEIGASIEVCWVHSIGSKRKKLST